MIREPILFRPFFSLLLLLSFSPFCTYEPTSQIHPRLQEVIKGCQIGQMSVYEDFFSNHVSDLQIAQFIQWVVTEKKCGVFHVGSVDVVRYRSFIGQLIGALNLKQPEFISQIVPGTMAVLSERNDIPRSLQWNSRQIVQYLGER